MVDAAEGDVTMSEITVLADAASTIEGTWVDGRPVIPASALPAAIGWDLKPEGLCRDDVCVPVADRTALALDQGVDLTAAASALDRPHLVDTEAETIVLGQPSSSRKAALRDRQAPDFTLPDLDGVPRTLASWTGKKRLLVAFSSW